ncbi:MAG TPA: ABC transporter permease [Gemmatimonadales bacterium]|nr:ABC transporter permease [Gemmatimonadales bacterium]
MHTSSRRRLFSALALLGVLIAVALFAPLLAPHDPVQQLDIIGLKHAAPSAEHPFGTDSYGRDVLSRVIHGARVSLGVAVVASLIAASIGALVGGIAGWRGGWVDAVLMRLVDVGLAIPRLLVLIAVAAFWGAPGPLGLAILVGATGWFGTSRIVRSEAKAIRVRDHVLAARAIGGSALQVFVRHVAPGVAPALIASLVMISGQAIVLEMGLSYLGLGVRPPQPSWGSIMNEGVPFIGTAWWVSLFPGLFALIAVAAVNAVGNALRERHSTAVELAAIERLHG